LEQAQELARVGDWRGDLVTGEITWSPMLFRIFGLDPATTEPTLERFRAAVHPDDVALLEAREAEAARTGRLDVVHRITRADGEVRTVHALATAEVDADGTLRVLTGTLQDVTEAREDELALLASEQQLERAVAASRDGWWEVELPDGTVRCSERWWELYGFGPDEVPLTLELVTSLVVAGEREAALARFRDALSAGEQRFEFRTTAQRRDGSSFPIELRVLVEHDPDGAPTRITGTTRDLTEVVRSERLQDEFLATVSHELRTPLTSIGGALELLQAGRGGPLDEGAADLLAVASRNTRRLRRLIDDLLDAERLATGRQGVVLRSQRLVPVLERTVHDHVARPDGGGVHLELEVAAPADLELPIDPDRIGQVLTNYLSNAVRYAPAGSTVRISVTRSDGQVRVGVLDRGPGVPEGFAERAFTRFSQADPDDARSRGGTGLGLAISREIIERHGGTVGYDSVPGRTEFYFALPLPS
jgi:PAS domain S-box-containing protein